MSTKQMKIIQIDLIDLKDQLNLVIAQYSVVLDEINKQECDQNIIRILSGIEEQNDQIYSILENISEKLSKFKY